MDINECKPFDRVKVFQSIPTKDSWYGKDAIIDSVDCEEGFVVVCCGGRFRIVNPNELERSF
jgi:hypothetical protein